MRIFSSYCQVNLIVEIFPLVLSLSDKKDENSLKVYKMYCENGRRGTSRSFISGTFPQHSYMTMYKIGQGSLKNGGEPYKDQPL